MCNYFYYGKCIEQFIQERFGFPWSMDRTIYSGKRIEEVHTLFQS